MNRRYLFVVTLLLLLAAPFLHVTADAQDSAVPDIARGRHVATALAGCADCHGAAFGGGRAFVRGGQTVYASNLTGGPGGVAAYSDADLRRAIRAGVAPDGTQLRVMPWREYAGMTDADVADVIAFLRSLPPVDDAIVRTGTMPAPTSAMPRSNAAAPSPQAQTGGAYLATIGGCTSCHGADLAGGNRFGDVVAPAISRAGIGTWSLHDFQTAMRTGTTPGGHVLAKIMPWESIGMMTDDELRTLYNFLEAQPATTR